MATKAIFTSDDLLRIQAETGKDYELVRGELEEVSPPSFRHGSIAGRTFRQLQEWADATLSGQVAVESGYTLERQPDTVRGSDVSFVAAGKLTPGEARHGFPELAPDLAGEVRSPNDTWKHLEDKARDYFAAGTRLVWLIEPDQFLDALRPDGQRQRLGVEDVVEAQDVLPGFRCRVKDFFPQEL